MHVIIKNAINLHHAFECNGGNNMREIKKSVECLTCKRNKKQNR